MKPVRGTVARAALTLSLAFALPGCVVAAVAAAGALAYGYVKYTDNEAFRDYRADVDDTWDATLDALNDHGHPVSSGTSYSAAGGTVEIDDVDVRVRPNSKHSTRVMVSVGTFSTDEHRERAAAILQSIGDELD